MSGRVFPFGDCLARDNELLVEHLQAVGQASGTLNAGKKQALWFLGGLCHDVGKARSAWQRQLKRILAGQAGRQTLPQHSPLGAAVLFWLALKWLGDTTGGRPHTQIDGELAYELVQVAIAVAAHHGELRDPLHDQPPWSVVVEAPADLDYRGLLQFVQTHFPEITVLGDVRRDFAAWLLRSREDWEQVFFSAEAEWRRFHRTVRFLPSAKLKMASRQLPLKTSYLIWADRADAGSVSDCTITEAQAGRGLSAISDYCRVRAQDALKKGASARLVSRRQQVQDQVSRAASKATTSVYTLEMPTGYGKTLSALRVALEHCAKHGLRRVVYVAPYLSILSQAADEVANATELNVHEHHHLSLLNEEWSEGKAEKALLSLSSWRLPVIATTFNQLFRGLFPHRAQETMRLSSLEKAFLIIDEPQVIDPGCWPLLLAVLGGATERLGCRCLITSATIPEGAASINLPLSSLSPGDVRPVNRYVLTRLSDSWDADLLAREACDGLQTHGNVAVVLNTVADAVAVFEKVKSAAEAEVYCLTGAMTPPHKANQIERIRKALASGSRVAVVCTQMIEAGVDLSFRLILRALPLFPSLVQVAGRANRHAEGALAQVRTAPFWRDGQDTRPWVYRDRVAREETDRLLPPGGSYSETEVYEVLHDYYRRCEERSSYIARAATLLEEAVLGKPTALAGVEPFGLDLHRVDVCITGANPPITYRVRRWMDKWSLSSPSEMLSLVENRLVNERFNEQGERRAFYTILRQFCVALPLEWAMDMNAAPVGQTGWLYRARPDAYDSEVGFAHWASKQGPTVAAAFI